MTLRQIQRALYLASRTASDLSAAKRGRLAERVARRYWHRSAIRAMRKATLW